MLVGEIALVVGGAFLTAGSLWYCYAKYRERKEKEYEAIGKRFETV
jgi:hypothetical protein